MQAIVRGFLGRRRFERIRQHVALFNRLTKEVAGICLEEVVLGHVMELILNFTRANDRYRLLLSVIDRMVAQQLDDIIESTVDWMCVSVAQETLTDAANYILLHRNERVDGLKNLEKSNNPLIKLLVELCGEVVGDFARPVVLESIMEEVHEYLVKSYGEYIYQRLSDDVVSVLVVRSIQDALMALLVESDEAVHPRGAAKDRLKAIKADTIAGKDRYKADESSAGNGYDDHRISKLLHDTQNYLSNLSANIERSYSTSSLSSQEKDHERNERKRHHRGRHDDDRQVIHEEVKAYVDDIVLRTLLQRTAAEHQTEAKEQTLSLNSSLTPPEDQGNYHESGVSPRTASAENFR